MRDEKKVVENRILVIRNGRAVEKWKISLSRPSSLEANHCTWHKIKSREAGISEGFYKAEIISETVFGYLPFSPEPLSKWSNTTDLLQFLYALYGVNYRESSRRIFTSGQKKFRDWVKRFTTVAGKATPAPAAVTQTIKIPDFSEDPKFGKVAKYIIAWDGVVEAVLSESAFFSIAHIMESDIDLECSLYLASQLYYKQALQVLRNFLEDLVLSIHFCDNPSNFLDWKKNNYRIPRLWGDNGILSKLVSKQILTKEVGEEISKLYGELNSSIHGSERRLIYRGIYSRKWMGQVFKYDNFSEWCDYLSRLVELGIRLLKVNITQWEKLRGNKVLCDICHNDKDFTTERYELGGVWRTHYHCNRCGSNVEIADK